VKTVSNPKKMSGSSNFLSDIGRKLFIGGRQLTIEKIIAEGEVVTIYLP